MQQEVFHLGEEIAVVGGAGQQQLVIFEGFCQGKGHIVPGQIHHGDFCALFPDHVRRQLRGLGGVAVEGAEGHQHARFLGGVAAPNLVFAHIFGQIAGKHRAVQGADGGDVQGRRFFQQGRNGSAVLAHDVEIIPPGLGQPGIGFRVAEGAECVGGEQHLFAALIGKHHLGPVHHGGGDELQGVRAKGQGIVFLYGHGAGGQSGVHELGQHGQGFGGHHQLHFGVLVRHGLDAAAVVGLQMGDHQIIRRFAVQGCFHVGKPFIGFPRVHGIHHGDFIIKNDIGIVRYARNFVLPLKQVNVPVVHANVFYAVGNLHRIAVLLRFCVWRYSQTQKSISHLGRKEKYFSICE